jgi:hypothetical protein
MKHYNLKRIVDDNLSVAMVTGSVPYKYQYPSTVTTTYRNNVYILLSSSWKTRGSNPNPSSNNVRLGQSINFVL